MHQSPMKQMSAFPPPPRYAEASPSPLGEFGRLSRLCEWGILASLDRLQNLALYDGFLTY